VSDAARLFVALPVPDAVRHGLERVQERVRRRADDLRFTRPEGWHVTLAFLGDVPGGRIDDVARVVDEAAAGHRSIRLTLGAPGRFGNRVLWVAVEDEPAGTAAALGARIQGAIAGAGLPVQEQAVRPHLTLARGGRGRPVRTQHLEDLTEALAGAAFPGSWVAEEAQVWRSELGRGPARYHVLSRTPLG
jgi:RNA 2',3'-cyclic 3'-phosphodiesterase